MDIEITVPIKIDEQAVRDLLTTAFEGGSNYWYTINTDETVLAKGMTYKDFQEDGKHTIKDSYHHPLELIPFVEGCAICIEDEYEDNKACMLDRQKIINGLTVMATDYPKHFADFMSDNADADTGDVFLQCCIFGECIYG
jgi:hypothetical protein